MILKIKTHNLEKKSWLNWKLIEKKRKVVCGRYMHFFKCHIMFNRTYAVIIVIDNISILKKMLQISHTHGTFYRYYNIGKRYDQLLLPYKFYDLMTETCKGSIFFMFVVVSRWIILLGLESLWHLSHVDRKVDIAMQVYKKCMYFPNLQVYL